MPIQFQLQRDRLLRHRAIQRHPLTIPPSGTLKLPRRIRALPANHLPYPAVMTLHPRQHRRILGIDASIPPRNDSHHDIPLGILHVLHGAPILRHGRPPIVSGADVPSRGVRAHHLVGDVIVQGGGQHAAVAVGDFHLNVAAPGVVEGFHVGFAEEVGVSLGALLLGVRGAPADEGESLVVLGGGDDGRGVGISVVVRGRPETDRTVATLAVESDQHDVVLVGLLVVLLVEEETPGNQIFVRQMIGRRIEVVVGGHRGGGEVGPSDFHAVERLVDFLRPDPRRSVIPAVRGAHDDVRGDQHSAAHVVIERKRRGGGHALHLEGGHVGIAEGGEGDVAVRAGDDGGDGFGPSSGDAGEAVGAQVRGGGFGRGGRGEGEEVRRFVSGVVTAIVLLRWRLLLDFVDFQFFVLVVKMALVVNARTGSHQLSRRSRPPAAIRILVPQKLRMMIIPIPIPRTTSSSLLQIILTRRCRQRRRRRRR
mmetsp:Transcript_27619/g.55157  ORF Transcript_27619/g.55157 Transcript_27619/m.55157 type:complete len:479 (+) Transcript_27619:1512-2948(+)